VNAAILARESIREANRGKVPTHLTRPGTVVGPTAAGDTVPLVMDGDPSDAGYTYATNTLGRSVQANERVLVTFIPPHGAIVTQALTLLATLPRFDSTESNSSAASSSTYVDTDLSVTFVQNVDGLPIVHKVLGHLASTVAGDTAGIAIRNAADATVYFQRLYLPTTATQGFYFEFREKPNASVKVRKISVARLAGSGDVVLGASSDRPAQYTVESAVSAFPA
jgi:hypothetical protein